MDKAKYEKLSKMQDHELFEWARFGEAATDGLAARHILEMRRIQRAAAAADRSAHAAMWAAIAAFGSLAVAIIGLLRH